MLVKFHFFNMQPFHPPNKLCNPSQLPSVLLFSIHFHSSLFSWLRFISLPLTVVRPTMPLQKGSSSPLPSEIVPKDQHPLKRKQPLSFDDRSSASSSSTTVDLKPSKNRLIRSDESPLLTQTPLEILLDLLKQFSGVKEISDETQVHLFMVKIQSYAMHLNRKFSFADFDGALFKGERNEGQFSRRDFGRFVRLSRVSVAEDTPRRGSRRFSAECQRQQSHRRLQTCLQGR